MNRILHLLLVIHLSAFKNSEGILLSKYYTITESISEEKRIKGGSLRKEELINSMNSEWKDLYEEIKLLWELYLQIASAFFCVFVIARSKATKQSHLNSAIYI